VLEWFCILHTKFQDILSNTNFTRALILDNLHTKKVLQLSHEFGTETSANVIFHSFTCFPCENQMSTSTAMTNIFPSVRDYINAWIAQSQVSSAPRQVYDSSIMVIASNHTCFSSVCRPSVPGL